MSFQELYHVHGSIRGHSAECAQWSPRKPFLARSDFCHFVESIVLCLFVRVSFLRLPFPRPSVHSQPFLALRREPYSPLRATTNNLQNASQERQLSLSTSQSRPLLRHRRLRRDHRPTPLHLGHADSSVPPRRFTAQLRHCSSAARHIRRLAIQPLLRRTSTDGTTVTLVLEPQDLD